MIPRIWKAIVEYKEVDITEIPRPEVSWIIRELWFKGYDFQVVDNKLKRLEGKRK